MKQTLLLLRRLNLERSSLQMINRLYHAVGEALVHVRQTRLHRLGRDHVHVLDAQRLEDVLLHVVVETHTRDALEGDAGPVEIYL